MRYTLVVLPLLALAGCGSATSPSAARAAEEASAPMASTAHAETTSVKASTVVLTPKATVLEMLELAEAGDWATYVDDFYGEAHKFRNASDRLQLIGMLEKRGPGIVESLRRVSTIDPTITSDGSQAVFPLGGDQRFTLYRNESGRWMFHL